MQTPRPNVTRFAGYEILRQRAEGVYTAVYEARHTHPGLRNRLVTLKVLHHNRDAEHFLRAMRLSADLDHPHIPTLYDVGEAAGRLYAARRFVEGKDLRNTIGEAKRSITEIVPIIAEIASALDYAHDRGVVHGYVHPRHILVGKDESIWLIGFGEFPPPQDTPHGNPLHLAPEQFEAGCRPTLASDVYALAETALWLLCECHPFQGLYNTELLEAKRTGRARREIQGFHPGISPELERVLRRGLATEPTGRYATAGEFAAALASAAGLGDRSRRWWFWR